MPCSSSAARCSGLSRSASSPPCTIGCRVLTRPSIISGKPVISATSRTGSPASRSARAVPPVESSSTPRPASARGQLDEAGLVGDRNQRAPDRHADRGTSGVRLLAGQGVVAFRSRRGGRLGNAAEGPGDLAQILDHLGADNHLYRRPRLRRGRVRNRPTPRASSRAAAGAEHPDLAARAASAVTDLPRRVEFGVDLAGADGSAPRSRAVPPMAASARTALRARASATVRISSPRSSWPRAST